jgi:hypothetical protein
VPLLAVPAAIGAQNASPEATITEDTIREIERARLQSLVNFDRDVAASLHADDFQLINPAGAALSRDDYLGSLESGFIDYLVFEPSSEIVVHLSPKSAILRYQSDLEIIVDGTNVPLSNYWHTDYYEERDGQWQAVWSQATEILS